MLWRVIMLRAATCSLLRMRDRGALRQSVVRWSSTMRLNQPSSGVSTVRLSATLEYKSGGCRAGLIEPVERRLIIRGSRAKGRPLW
jgi:hypothetical protein